MFHLLCVWGGGENEKLILGGAISCLNTVYQEVVNDRMIEVWR